MKTAPFLVLTAAIAASQLVPWRPVVVTGRSMMPSLNALQVVVGSKDIGELQRGDVVVVDTPNGRAIKRVAYIEGDVIPKYFYKGDWMIPLTREFEVSLNRLNAQREDVRVEKGYVYVLGDNLQESSDSRHYGPVPVRNVRLKVSGVADVGLRIPGAHLASIHDRQPGNAQHASS